MAEEIENTEETQQLPEIIQHKVRRLNDAEIESWSKAIHELCSANWVPALRAAFAHLMPFVDEGCPTAYTDCQYRVGLNPKFLDLEQTPLQQLAFIILHETMHNTQKHRQRLLEKKGLNGKLCNFATDLEINSIIAEGTQKIDLSRPAGPANGHWENLFGEFKQIDAEQAAKLNEMKTDNGSYVMGKAYKAGDWFYQGGLFPGNGQFSDFPTNQTAEAYLGLLECDVEEMTLQEFMDRLKQMQGDSTDDGDGSQNGGSGSQDDQQGGQSGSSSQGGSGDQDGSQGQSGGTPQAGDQMQDGCGGNATVNGGGHVTVTKIYKRNADGSRSEVGRDNVVDQIDMNMGDELWDAVSKLGINPISRSEEQKVKEQIAHDIENSRRSNSYGYGAGDMLLNYVSKGLRPPIVDWKRALRHATSRACQQQCKGHDDYTFRRTSRRYTQGKFISPGMTAYVPKIRFALDTSGSMSQDEYFNALSEAEAVLRLNKASVECCCVDTVASEVIPIKTVADMTKKMVGGGGTDMAVAVNQVVADKKRDRPDVLIIATDGCFDWGRLGESLKAPEVRNLVPIVIVVYKFTEDTYWSKQGEIAEYEKLLRTYHKKAQVLQAWA